MPVTYFRTCNLCEAMCGLAITVEGDRVLDIRGDDEDPLSRGHVCPKAVALKDIHEDPDRLKRPLRREGSRWIEISWEQAFDEVTARLEAVREKYGRAAVGFYQGNPTVHNYGSILFGQIFARTLRTPNNFSATSLDQLPHMLAALQMFGHQLLMPVPDLDRTNYLLILGANPAASNGSLMTAPDVKRRLKEIQDRGGKVVLIDPRRTETADLADRHLFVRPGTDVYFLAALINAVISKQGGPRLGRVAKFTDGVEVALAALQGLTAENTESLTGISAADTLRIADELVGAPAAVAYGRVGLSTQEFGGLCTWLLNVLNIVSGNFDKPGGWMYTKPAVDAVALATRIGLRGSYAGRRSRVRSAPEFGGELPAAVLAEEMETPGKGQIKALVTSAGNPVLSAPNGRRIEKALDSLELMVSIDIYLNETTKHAHYILPPTFSLEHSHFDLPFHLLAVRNTVKFGEAIFPRSPDQRHDWEIFGELAARLQVKSALDRVTFPLRRRAILTVTPERIIDLALRFGPYRGMTLSKVKAAPHGIDLGPLESCLPERLGTENKRINLAPKIYLDDLERAKARMRDRSNGGLELIGRRQLRSNNSWMHNSARLVKGKNRCTLLMHPSDAEKRGLSSGGKVVVRSAVGAIEVELEVSADVMPGVVSLPHGFGHDRPGTRLAVAAQHAGASINDVTLDSALDVLSGTSSFSGVPVEVSPAAS